ncbi:MAG: polysaccharide deacetylase family protein [Flavobacteriales bacterium]|nr:polysaccharide deacetylase family protein [Flavobacteriales bacterium]
MDSLIKKTDHNLILPFYHIVSDDNPVHIKNLYQPRSIKRFKEDLAFLLENYKSISLKELISLNKEGKTIDENCFHLTFDDGLSEFYTVVAPILKEKNIHATVFLNSNFIDNKELFYRFKASILFEELKDEDVLAISYNNRNLLDDLALKNGIDFNEYLKEKSPYLTSVQIKELIAQGVTFGAHSKSHPLYKELSFEEQIIETKESIETVVDQFKLAYKVFSFPFTDDGVSKAFFDAITNCTDITFGCAGLKEDNAPKHFQRIAMETNKSGKEIIKAEYLYYLMKEKAGKHKIIRQ